MLHLHKSRRYRTLDNTTFLVLLLLSQVKAKDRCRISLVLRVPARSGPDNKPYSATRAWRPNRKKDIDKLERIQRRSAKMIPELRHLSYESRLL